MKTFAEVVADKTEESLDGDNYQWMISMCDGTTPQPVVPQQTDVDITYVHGPSHLISGEY